MQNIQANARLTGDGHKVILDTIGIHELGHIGTHVPAKQAGCKYVVAQLQQHAAHVEALAASGLFGRHAVNIVDDQLVELIARIDRRVHGNGQNHVGLLFRKPARAPSQKREPSIEKLQNAGYRQERSTQAKQANVLSEQLAKPKDFAATEVTPQVTSTSARSQLVRQGAVKRGGVDLLVMPSKLNGRLPTRWLRSVGRSGVR